jgi:hypothetical protein
MFSKEVATFRLFAGDEGTAGNVAEVLRRNSGRNLRELGILKVAYSV